jgi:hypothetical protein
MVAFITRLGLLVGISVLGFVIIVNVLVPSLVDALVHEAQAR